jgi:hypothetical protein
MPGGFMKVISLKERKDGSATMTYELTKREENMFKKHAEKKNKIFSRRFINSEILNALKEAMKLEKTAIGTTAIGTTKTK